MYEQVYEQEYGRMYEQKYEQMHEYEQYEQEYEKEYECRYVRSVTRNKYIRIHTLKNKYNAHVSFLGAGKSAVIRVAAMHAEKILRKAGDNPNCPKVLLLAHTGKASSLIGKSIL